MVPTGKIGDVFVSELSRLFGTCGESIALVSVALLAAMTMLSLLLQRLFAHSKTKDHIQCLENCLLLWRDGNISQLLTEGRYIRQQVRYSKGMRRDGNDKLVRHFLRLMGQDKLKSALRLVLKSERMVLDVNSPAGDGDTQTICE